jgi:tRNA-2-methylthio-N6-dimethylallyladenosine synthase
MKSYSVRTFGCQMNKHDSERVAGLLRSAGMRPAVEAEDPDLVVFMTCCVRGNADERALGQVASLKALKSSHPAALIAVGGCIGQRDGEALLREIPHVDIVFGTHNIGRLPELIALAEASDSPIVEVLDSSDEFASDLPSSRERSWHAWIPITVGCDNYCSYCIVPYVRGPERSRPIEEILAEASTLVGDGVKEITLLGQNVNSYGRDVYGEPRFAEVLERVADSGVSRVRFATSHPKDLSPETIRVLREIDEVCPYLHLPVQSGSDRILQAMNRRYTRDSYMDLVQRVYDSVPGIALSTDVIVGFPGETDEDFEDTLDLVERGRFDQAFTFIYSPREGTPAAKLEDRVPRETAQARFDRLVEVVHRSAQAKNAALVGSTTDVLFEGTSKRDDTMLTGRTPTNKVVHVPLTQDARTIEGDAPATLGTPADRYVGRILPVNIEASHTWFLTGSLA